MDGRSVKKRKKPEKTQTEEKWGSSTWGGKRVEHPRKGLAQTHSRGGKGGGV